MASDWTESSPIHFKGQHRGPLLEGEAEGLINVFCSRAKAKAKGGTPKVAGGTQKMLA